MKVYLDNRVVESPISRIDFVEVLLRLANDEVAVKIHSYQKYFQIIFNLQFKLDAESGIILILTLKK